MKLKNEGIYAGYLKIYNSIPFFMIMLIVTTNVFYAGPSPQNTTGYNFHDTKLVNDIDLLSEYLLKYRNFDMELEYFKSSLFGQELNSRLWY